MRGLDNKILTHLVLVLSGASETAWMDVVVMAIVAGLEVLVLEPDVSCFSSHY